jgi:glutamine synthetase
MNRPDGIKAKFTPAIRSTRTLRPRAGEPACRCLSSLEQALDCLADREYLKAGGVFSDDTIDSYTN